MNEFIVWYTDGKNIHSREYTLEQLISNDHLDYLCDSRTLGSFRVDSILQSIGTKDINNKKIYADSSIVECIVKQEKVNMYVFYDVCTLSFRFCPVEIYPMTVRDISFNKIVNPRIIDTIQENKLGLIK